MFQRRSISLIVAEIFFFRKLLFFLFLLRWSCSDEGRFVSRCGRFPRQPSDWDRVQWCSIDGLVIALIISSSYSSQRQQKSLFEWRRAPLFPAAATWWIPAVVIWFGARWFGVGWLIYGSFGSRLQSLTDGGLVDCIRTIECRLFSNIRPAWGALALSLITSLFIYFFWFFWLLFIRALAITSNLFCGGDLPRRGMDREQKRIWWMNKKIDGCQWRIDELGGSILIEPE